MALECGLEGRDQLLKLVERQAREIQELHWTGLQLGEPYTCHGSCLLSRYGDVRGASYQKESGINSNLDGGFDSRANRKCIFNAGMLPNITENPRNRKTTKRGRKRFFNEAIHALRMRVERTFAWEDKFKRLLLRFERIQQRHYGMKLMAYTLINLRAFCGV